MIDERQLNHLRGFDFLRQLSRRTNLPTRCLVPAGRALQRDSPLFEVQQRVVTVETTKELPNLIGNHCAETPFKTYPV